VALSAAYTERLLMRVILAVACVASIVSDFVISVEMTFLARCTSVQANEGKLGHVMIEYYLFVPATFVMAALAFFSFLAFVDVITSMAGVTACALLFLFDVAAMAVLAAHVFVRAIQ